MDIELEKSINETIEYLNRVSEDNSDYKLKDPVAKMMLVALLHECQKIKDYLEGIGEKIVDRFCEDFIPRREIEAMPAVSIIEPAFKIKKDTEILSIGSGASFGYKLEDNKQQINYIPIFNTLCIPYDTTYVLTQNKLIIGDVVYDISMANSNDVWLGINTKAEIDSLQGLSIFIRGTEGVLPKRILVGEDENDLEYSNISSMENIDMAEPFDSQQSSGQFLSIVENWKDIMKNMCDSVVFYITDDRKDRDIFKLRAYPKKFSHWLESEMLDCFKENTIWLHLEFPENYIVPDTLSVSINVLPVANVDVNNVTLTQISPIAKLQKQENSFFLQILETSNTSNKQGFNMIKDEIIVRDFDASCYHAGKLYRDVRNIYNHFIDDYYAFVEYNSIKDGEIVKQLRDVINRVGKGVGTVNPKYNFDSGTYVMKNMNQSSQSSSIKVSYATTLGKLGNIPVAGEVLENKKLPSIERDVKVLVSAMGGADKASADEKYENLRYYSLTNDRLFSKKDIEAFMRKEIISEFGKSEYKRIFVKLDIEGAAGVTKLQRGLYITVEFKDKKNFEKAMNSSFKYRIYQKILNRSCISMPIEILLVSLDN